MKKTISIHLGGSAFIIDEDAYALLDEYLSAIRSHFSDGEVVNDIEARIAERFSEKTGDRIIELHDVQTLITIMGRVEDIIGEADAANEPQSSHSDSSATRKLYRDYDNRVIEGVASGCAAYVGIDATLMRIIFIIITLMSGFWLGVLAYVVLAIVLPKAVTPTEKMRMRGGPVTLSSFEQMLREKATDIESRHHIIDRTREFVSRVFHVTGTIFRSIVSGLIRVSGGFVALVSSVTLIIGCIIFVNVLVNSGAEYIRFPLFEVMSRALFYSAVSLAFILCAIPVGAALLIGVGLLRKRMIANAGVVFAILIGIWIIGVGAASVLWIRHGYSVEQRINSLPQYKTVEQSVEVAAPIVGVHAIDGARVVVVSAPTSSVVVSGPHESVARTSVEKADGVITIRRGAVSHSCMFCNEGERVVVTIGAPALTELIAENGSRISSESSFVGALNVVATDGAHIDLSDATLSDVTMRAEDGGYIVFDTANRARLSARDGAIIRYNKTTELVESVVERGASIQSTRD